jgi:hypothetical protein
VYLQALSSYFPGMRDDNYEQSREIGRRDRELKMSQVNWDNFWIFLIKQLQGNTDMSYPKYDLILKYKSPEK